jgi:hypothetical protein
MNVLAELELTRREIQEEIDGYRGTAGYCHNERIRSQLKIACLEREIIGFKISLLNTTNEEERTRKDQQIETNKHLIHDLYQHRLLPPQQMVVAQPGKFLFLFLYCT